MTEHDVPDGIDGDGLADYLATEWGTLDRLTARRLDGGNANESLLVTIDGTHEFVLRRPPPAQPVPDLLHDVVGEYEILDRLASTAVPTPDPVCCCRDAGVIGTPFYLMERVAGSPLDGSEPEHVARPDRRRALGESVVAALASFHEIDPPGREADIESVNPAAAVDRHTDRLEGALERTATERELPRARDVGAWLAANAPAPTEPVLVHGDYKPDNLLVAPDLPPRLGAILDWEMAGAGDPLADLGWLLAFWAESDDPDPVDERFRQRFGDHELYEPVVAFVGDGRTAREGYPSRAELVALYEDRTGRTYAHDRFYRALALYKLVSICEAFYAHYLDNPAAGKPTYPLMAVLVPLIAARAEAIVTGA